MNNIRFGACGMMVSPLCFGTMTLGGEVDEDTSLDLLDTAYDGGINFIDTANQYNDGLSETIVGRWLKQRNNRDQVVLSSKVYYPYNDDPQTRGLNPRTIHRELHRSLRRLNTDYLDIYFLHQPDYDTPIEVTWHCLDSLVRQGKIRCIGLSNFASWQICDAFHLARASGWVQPTAIQCMYNLIARYPDLELFPMCDTFDLGVCNYNPLAGGLLTGKYPLKESAKEGRMEHNKMYQDRYWHPQMREAANRFVQLARDNNRTPVELAIRFCLDNKTIDTVILGATRVAQLKQCLEAIHSETLSSGELEKCQSIWNDLSGRVPSYAR